MPWSALAGSAVVVLALSTLTAIASGRQAMSLAPFWRSRRTGDRRGTRTRRRVRQTRFLASPLVLCRGRALAADDYPPVVAGRGAEFPRDAGAHPAFRNEWWYITGWLATPTGRSTFGIQVTFFRNRPRVAEANPSAFAPRQLLFAHAAIADPRYGRLRHDQRAARAGFGLADAAEDTTAAWIDDWSLKLVGRRYVAAIAARDFRFELRFAPTQAVLLAGRARLFAQRAERRERELLLQPAAPRGVGHGRDRGQGRERQRHGLARSRMVERGTGAPRPAAGTGSASTSTTAAR